MGYIYKTLNTLNNRIYIGQHNSRDSAYLGSGTYFRNAVKKHGKENFLKEILEDDIEDNDLLNQREIHWIDLYNSTNRDIGYNIVKGGGGGLGIIHSPETRLKLSKAMGNKHTGKLNPMYGKSGIESPTFGRQHTSEEKAKMSEACKGRVATQETKDKMSKMRKGNLHPLYGKSPSQETRNKMSKTLKGKYVGELNPNYGRQHTQKTKDKMKACWQERKKKL